MPQLYPIEPTLADLKLGYSQTITELNAYTVNKPTTHPTHLDRNQHGKSDVIIVTTWGHLARDCLSAPTCSFCKQEGHIRRDCELYETDQAR